ncbi:MAG: hypothetical protein B1H12_10780 [Desulfobacteraceae bacterium 4484_190.2]|nr:MAG: hypothetical protein B1H12_10780 [Desulfobacteraceae bacterium 4484_190.2]
MIRLNDITSQILSYHPKANIDLVEKAYVYSAKAHQGQIRLSGEPYLSHPLEVAYILTKMKMDVTCIAAGLLHDTIEDTEAEPDEIKRLFGEETANIVEGVTKISRMQFTNRQQRQAENVRKMILAMSSDIRVILVKLADRLHNMRTLGFQPPEKQRLIAAETEDIYAPLAGRMGIQWIKSSLEDLCLYYLEPKIYEDIKNEIAQTRDKREEFIKNVIELVSKKLEEETNTFTVSTRKCWTRASLLIRCTMFWLSGSSSAVLKGAMRSWVISIQCGNRCREDLRIISLCQRQICINHSTPQ